MWAGPWPPSAEVDPQPREVGREPPGILVPAASEAGTSRGGDRAMEILRAAPLPSFEEMRSAVRFWGPVLRRRSRLAGPRAEEAYAAGLVALMRAVARGAPEVAAAGRAPGGSRP